MSPIESNLQHIRARINGAIAGLPSASQKSVVLVAVSKTKSAHEVRTAFAAGQRDFGENYVQEATAKIAALGDLEARGIIWHFIGPLQSNKLKLVATNFDWVHGIDRLKVATALSRHRGELLPVRTALNVCVQVNVSGEASKGGVRPEAAFALATQVGELPHLKLRGLMTIIENTADEATQRAQLRRMRTLFKSMQEQGLNIDTLSMGMSQDFAVAIAEGATMVRIGSAIFGARE
jgi:PLP dependent protein